MFSSKEANNKTEKLHKRALQIIHNDSTSDYRDLLLRIKSVAIHKRNLQFLMTETFKTLHNANPSFMKEIFVREEYTQSKLKYVWDLHHYLSEAVNFGICFLMNLRLYQVCPLFKDKIKDWNGSNGRGFLVFGFCSCIWHCDCRTS